MGKRKRAPAGPRIDESETKSQEWTTVESSNLKAIRRVGTALEIEFRTGARYLYPGAAGHFDGLLASPSPGGYFVGKIRPLQSQKTRPMTNE